ncbi:hypothetical protein WOLCODRAFT_17738 [Wolfiporia cocos MD-104 SS10]|uniref:Uncharacterized protein n=1 Tax=Wolfiporia cocos (strain MD-104) TaxID=742152 RepID=A0A2H3JJV6_WOLCO|nr:hypothetical protein WOLCODRAFT_17738 [Wolfiporia cocos MD-104 SS10]
MSHSACRCSFAIQGSYSAAILLDVNIASPAAASMSEITICAPMSLQEMATGILCDYSNSSPLPDNLAADTIPHEDDNAYYVTDWRAFIIVNVVGYTTGFWASTNSTNLLETQAIGIDQHDSGVIESNSPENSQGQISLQFASRIVGSIGALLDYEGMESPIA